LQLRLCQVKCDKRPGYVLVNQSQGVSAAGGFEFRQIKRPGV